MNKVLKSLVFIGIFTAISSASIDAQANINSVTGSGSLNTIGDEITGEFDLGTSSVDYTLTLDDISGIGQVDWNGTGNAEGSPNPGFSFDGNIPSLSDTWTATLEFSQPVIFDFEQNIIGNGFQNQGTSQFGIDWIGATSTPSILDPDNQLQDESVSPGLASFRISTNPGVGNTNNGGSVFNNAASWEVEGVAASEIELTWSAATATNTQHEFIAINGDSFEAVPVPFEASPNLGILILGGMFAGSRYIKHKRRTNIIEE